MMQVWKSLFFLLNWLKNIISEVVFLHLIEHKV